jgi:hypothetical protein
MTSGVWIGFYLQPVSMFYYIYIFWLSAKGNTAHLLDMRNAIEMKRKPPSYPFKPFDIVIYQPLMLYYAFQV